MVCVMKSPLNPRLISLTEGASVSSGKQKRDQFFSIRHCCFCGHGAFVALFLLILAAFFSPAPSMAGDRVSLSDAEMAGVTGQAGITIFTDGEAYNTVDIIKFSDTDSTPKRWIELQNFAETDSSGGYFSFDTDSDYPVTIDVGTTAGGQTLVAVQESTHYLPRWYHVENFVFCDQSLGNLHLDALSLGPSLSRYGSHTDGTTGIDFDYATRLYAQALRYTYNATEKLELSDIHLAYAPGAGDDPRDPATWSMTGNFKIGDIVAGAPAMMDVATDTSNVTSVVLNLPMQGSLRVEKVAFGSIDFGPVAIDGINVHHLNLQIK